MLPIQITLIASLLQITTTCVSQAASSASPSHHFKPDATSTLALADFCRQLEAGPRGQPELVCNETGHSVRLDNESNWSYASSSSSWSVNRYSGELEPAHLEREPPDAAAAAPATSSIANELIGSIRMGGPAVELTQEYVEEMKGSFKVLVWDSSLDQRLANLLYLISAKTVVVYDSLRFNSGSREQDLENERLVAGSSAPEDIESAGRLCGEHLAQMVATMEELAGLLEARRRNASAPLELQERHLRLARVLDSYGRYESGFFSGRVHSFGSYNQCRNTPLLLGPSRRGQSSVGSRYCWARLGVEKHLSQALRVREREPLEPTSYDLTAGVCLPESCALASSFGPAASGNLELVQRLVGSQFQLPSSIYLEETLQVRSVFCTVDEQASEVRVPTSGRVLLALLALWLALAGYVTWNYRQLAGRLPAGKLKDLVMCLNLKESWLEFLGARRRKQQAQHGRVDLNTLNPVRCFGCAFVVWAHTLMAKHGYSIEHLELPKRFEESMMGGLVVVNSSIVDTFFTITGIIVAYLVMRKSQRQPQRAGPSGAPIGRASSSALGPLLRAAYSIVKTRYLRLAPLLLLVYWFKRSVFIYLGSGPLWDYGFNRETLNGACREESWLVPLFVAAAFKPLSRQCLMQSWSVSNDFFALAVLSPLLVVMTRRPRLAFGMMFLLAGASQAALLGAIAGLSSEDGYALRELKSQGMGAMFARVSHIYASPNYRISAFIVGIVAGYLLHWHEERQQQQQADVDVKVDEDADEDADKTRARAKREAIVWPRWFRGPVTWLSAGYILAVVVLLSNAPRFKRAIQPHHTLLFPFFMTLGKALWSASNAVVFLRMMTDWNASFLMRASRDRFWQVLSRLNYAVLLVHFDLILYDITASLYPDLNNAHSTTRSFALVYLASLLVATLLHVLFESPIERAIKRLLLEQQPLDGGATTKLARDPQPIASSADAETMAETK